MKIRSSWTRVNSFVIFIRVSTIGQISLCRLVDQQLLLQKSVLVVANQFGSWPFGRAGWCAGQDVKQWVYDITDWVDNSSINNLEYKGLFNGQEYVPQDTNGGGREIRANIWLVYYDAI